MVETNNLSSTLLFSLGNAFDSIVFNNYNYNSKYALSTPIRDGYSFNGWYYKNALVNQNGSWGINDSDVKKIDKYELPTDDELMLQSVNQIICESCYLIEQCSRFTCIRNPKELKALRKSMMDLLKSKDK